MKALFFGRRIMILYYFFFSFLSFSQIQPGMQGLNLVSPDDFTFNKKIHPVALKAIQKGLKPAEFKNVQVTYSNNVTFINTKLKSILPELFKQPVIDIHHLQQANIQPGKIYIDPETDLVFKPVKVTKDTVVFVKPVFDEVFKDIKLPRQSAKFNLANTDYTLSNTKVEDGYDEKGNYLMKMEFNDTLYHLSKKIKKGSSTTQIELDVHLNGFIGITDPVLTAEYSKNGGYVFTVNVKEDLDIETITQSTLEEKVAFPIWGYDIPMEDYGSCKIGIFLVFEANGEVNLKISVDQGVDLTAGVQGDTYYFIPSSMNPVFDMDRHFDLNYEINGKLKAFAGMDVTAAMEFKGYDIMNLRARGGAEGLIEYKNGDESKFKAELGARFLVDGKFEAKYYKKKFELYNKYYLLWKKEAKNYSSYIMNVYEADAYYDRVWGSVYKVENNDTIASSNNHVKIKVTHPNGASIVYNAITDDKGIFAKENIPLKKGDLVYIKAEGSPNYTDAFDVNIPFTKIDLIYADYYTNTLVGSVNSSISYFPRSTKSNTQQKIGNITMPAGIIHSVEKPLLSTIKNPHIKITPELFKNAITYKGDIHVVTEPVARQVDLKLPAINTGDQPNKADPKKRAIQLKKLNKFNTKPVKIKEIPKNIFTKKVTNLPFGMFRVEGVDIKPGDKVKARINIDGFVLESDYIFSDGLVISPIEHVNLKGGPSSPVIQADDSYVVINAFRSNKTPQGNVHMIAGIDMKHHSPVQTMPMQNIEIPKLKEIPQAQHPLVFFNVNKDLHPLAGHPGFAKADTGPWKVKNIYYSKKNILQLGGMDGHRFMYVGYPYDGRWTGIKYYQEKCSICSSVLSRINNKQKKPNNTQLQNIFKQATKGIK